MNKKLIAVAVASALGAPAVAMAQGASTVQIYGTMYLEYDWADQGTSPAFNAAGVPVGDWRNVDFFQTPGSNIGFKGEEALGGGLSAWFQCESTASPNIAGAAFCSRNSAIGLKGGWGNLFFGQWDTPYKRTQGITRGIVNETGVYGTAFLMGGNSTTTNANALPGTFIRRQSNTISYDSPNWGGFMAMAQVSTSGSSVGQLNSQTSGKARLWSLGLQYVNGPLAVTGAYEMHKNFNGVATAGATGATFGNSNHGGDDKGWHIGAAYTFPVGGGLKIGGHFAKQKFELGGPTAGTIAAVDRKAWQIAGDWKIAGPHGLRAAYTKALDTKGSTALGPAPGAVGAALQTPCIAGSTCIAATAGDNGADLWQIIYYYTFSKRTEVGVGYVRLDNDSLGRYSLGGLPTPANGQNQDAFAFHIRHTF